MTDEYLIGDEEEVSEENGATGRFLKDPLLPEILGGIEGMILGRPDVDMPSIPFHEWQEGMNGGLKGTKCLLSICPHGYVAVEEADDLVEEDGVDSGQHLEASLWHGRGEQLVGSSLDSP